MHPLTKVRGDVDQRIKREARNAPPQKLIDARLRAFAGLVETWFWSNCKLRRHWTQIEQHVSFSDLNVCDLELTEISPLIRK